MCGLIECLSICGWLMSHSTSSRCMHVSCIRLSVLIIFHSIYTPCFLFIHLSMDTWVATTFWILWVMLWTRLYTYLFESLLSFLLGMYQEVGLLGHLAILCLNFWRTLIRFSTAVKSPYISTRIAQGFQYLHVLPNSCCNDQPKG